MLFAIYYLMILGLIYAVTESYILRFFRLAVRLHLGRFFTVLVYCPACSGFWLGAGMGYWFPLEGFPWWVRTLVSAVTSMGLGAIWSRGMSADTYEVEGDIIEDAQLELIRNEIQ